jgi:hypothetical protein
MAGLEMFNGFGDNADCNEQGDNKNNNATDALGTASAHLARQML